MAPSERCGGRELTAAQIRIEEIEMCGKQRPSPWVVLGLLVVALPLAACQRPRAASDEQSHEQAKPSKVEKIQGSELSRLTLTAKAAQRLDIKTADVREELKGRSGPPTLRKVIPYAAILYDATGATWVYTNLEPLVFVRHSITVDYIDGDVAILSDGPAAGVKVVTVGASLLYGTEFEVGEG
jgi:hypothetical protein